MQANYTILRKVV